MSEMSLEEQALRYADEFFTDESLWLNDGEGWRGEQRCIGAAIIDYFTNQGDLGFGFGPRLDEICGVSCTQVWNDYNCPNFAALKAKLQERILFYQKQRLSQSYLVIIGPGRQVRI